MLDINLRADQATINKQMLAVLNALAESQATGSSGGGDGTAAWGDITGTLASQSDLQSALNGKQASGSYAAATHGHAMSDVSGLSSALSAKQNSLVSGTDIKTINGSSVLGSGDLTVSGSTNVDGGSAASTYGGATALDGGGA